MGMTHNTARDRLNSAGLAREARSNRLTSVNGGKLIWIQTNNKSLVLCGISTVCLMEMFSKTRLSKMQDV